MQKITKADGLVETQSNEVEKMSKFRMRVFSVGRDYVLSAETAEDMEMWITAMQGSLAEHYSHEEMVQKAEAAEILLPLIKEQTKAQFDVHQQQIQALTQVSALLFFFF